MKWTALGMIVGLLCLGIPVGWGMEELEGTCYRFLYEEKDFAAWEVERYAAVAESRCQDLTADLGISPEEPIPVYLRPGRGISTTLPHHNRAIDLYFMRPIDGVEAPLVHETTHILADSPHPVLREGLAVLMEERWGTLFTHPTYGFSLKAWMEAIRCSRRYIALSQWEGREWRSGPWETNILAYVESGSFVGFLAARFGLERLMRALAWSRGGRRITLARICEARFGASLRGLEAQWLEEIEERGLPMEVRDLCRALEEDRVQGFLRERLRSRRPSFRTRSRMSLDLPEGVS
jgi:hypothetical protein